MTHEAITISEGAYNRTLLAALIVLIIYLILQALGIAPRDTEPRPQVAPHVIPKYRATLPEADEQLYGKVSGL